MSERSSGSSSLTYTSFSPVSLALLSVTFTEREAVSILSWESEKGLKFRVLPSNHIYGCSISDGKGIKDMHLPRSLGKM